MNTTAKLTAPVYLPGRILDHQANGVIVRAEPEIAPPLLTAEQAGRLLLLDEQDRSESAIYQALHRLRRQGKLRAAVVGTTVRYPLAEVLAVIEHLTEKHARH